MQRRIQLTLIPIIAVVLASGCQPGQLQPTPIASKAGLPFDWPTTPLTQEQILAVKQCDVESLLKQRYPDSVASADLLETYQPQTDCDWAILAMAYANRTDSGKPLTEAAQQAFTHALANNIGYALATPLFYKYFGAVEIVKSPVFAQQAITNVTIKYSWWGLGDKVDYSVEIHQADTSPVVTSTYSETHPIDKPAIQALAPALTDLLPIRSKFQLQPCYDNYPVWSVSLTFADKRSIELTTNSNFMYIGGPWFTEVDHQVYLQFSPAFGQTVGKLVESLGLPFGQTAAMSCFGDTVFEKAFP